LKSPWNDGFCRVGGKGQGARGNNSVKFKAMENQSEILLYQTEDGQTKVEVRLDGETVWLTLNQLAELLQTTKQNVSLHIKNIYREGEVQEAATVKEYLTVQQEGNRTVQRSIAYYNLDMIISVGYRVNSHRGTQFRIWATQRLKEYIIKGFTLDDDRLKRNNQMNYFDELLARIRDIRSSEKVLLSFPLFPHIVGLSLPQGVCNRGKAVHGLSYSSKMGKLLRVRNLTNFAITEKSRTQFCRLLAGVTTGLDGTLNYRQAAGMHLLTKKTILK